MKAMADIPAGWHQSAGYIADEERRWRIYPPRRPQQQYELWQESPRPQEGGPAKSRLRHRGSLASCIEFAEGV